MADPTLIHGSRTERLFEATVLSLGHFRLLKTEDVGRVHAAVSCRAPDFRIVLDDGEQWLVEVKNVRSPEPFKQKTQMSAAYLASLQTYADMVGAPLKLAIFWSLWNIWTVISPERFRSPNGGLRITMKDAVLANESGRLGEVIIMTKAPLRVVLGAATDMPHSLSPEGLTNFIIGSAKLYSGEVELTDLRDRKLAEVLLFYGEWSTEGPLAITDGGEFGLGCPLLDLVAQRLLMALQLFLFGDDAGGLGSHLDLHLLHLFDHQTQHLLRLFTLVEQAVQVGIDHVGQAAEYAHGLAPC